MRRGGDALLSLAALLRGEPAADAGWTAVLALANRTLLTPALFVALRRADGLGHLPADVRDYLAFLHGRNLERNTRLRAQLIEAILALNQAGVEPTLLKGAVRLFQDEEERLGSRITRDLDLSVEEGESEAARACLLGIGYRDAVGFRAMLRPQDVGVLELRDRPRAASARYLPRAHRLASRLVAQAGVRARIPSPTARALHWMVHDLIKEGDYWRGRIDLRHLHDLAELAWSERDVDWAGLPGTMPDRLGRNAIETQLVTLQTLFGIALPRGMRPGAIVRLQHRRRMFTAQHPLAGAPLRLAGNLAWGVRRMGAAGILTGGFADRAFRTLAGSGAGAKL
jgi:hypothetical protein